MVTFFDIISFFAIAALFAWLGYGPLLWEKKVPKGLRPVTEFFIFSFGFYAASAITDYSLHYLEGIRLAITPSWIFAPLWTVTLVVVVGTFILGSETLALAMYYIRRFVRIELTEADIPSFKFVMKFTYLMTLSLSSAVVGYFLSHTIVGKSNFAIMALFPIVGAYKYSKSWRNPSAEDKRMIVYPIYATFLWIIVSAIMYLAFGWPF